TFTISAAPAVVVNQPANSSTSTCAYVNQAAVDAAFAQWLTGFTVSGGCDPHGNYGQPTAPAWCTGGTTSVTYTVTDKCYATTTVTRTFTITRADKLNVVCPGDTSVACGSNANDLFIQWIAGFSYNGGCPGAIATDLSQYQTAPLPGQSVTITYSVTDGCQSVSCTSKFTVQSCSHIFPTQTTCCNYSTGTATGLYNVCTTVSGPGITGGTVTNAVPGVMFYYSNVVAPAASFTIEVKQSNDGDLNKLFQVHGYDKGSLQQIRLYTSSCENVSFKASFISNGTGAKYIVTGATPGATYIVSVKYNVKSIQGGVYSGSDRTSKYTFACYLNGSGLPAADTSGTIDAVSGCQDNTPLPADCTMPLTTARGEVVTIEDNFGLSVIAYPNPYSNNFNLNVKTLSEDKVSLSVYDMLGRLIENRDLNPRETSEIKIGDRYPSGIYNVIVTQGDEVKTLRVIKR
ncbi:T9SS type A sorting domain-containing protein, partial [Flavobacterium sp.]|uniref:T9SS type A sorting domain-containing protein n=1 Tax=Flavobacterium sp. TaxID=239 RepID=UPI002FDA6950